MKISNKEKIMLYILGIIIVGFAYYQFVYLPQLGELQKKLSTENEIKQKYYTVMNTINSMEDKKSSVKILKAKISDEELPFYPTISEEQIIIELDKLLKNSDLDGGITFQPIVSNSVENSKKEQKSLAESSLQGIVDEYNNPFNSVEKEQQNVNDTAAKNEGKDKASNNGGTNNAKNSKSSNENGKNDTKKNTVQYLKCEVKFEGDYEGLDKFLDTIGENEKKIIVNSVKISSDTLKGVKGTINLEFYAIPKINDDLQSYLKWDFTDNYGKTVPFASGEVSEGTSTATKQDEKVSDFIGSVKPLASDLPTIMLGKAKDDLRTTYVYADSNSDENIEMILTQNGDKYYYKYKTSKGIFPVDYNGLGAEFAPASKNIVLDISSRSRLDENDNSGMKLKITNKTDKLLEVNISGDDISNPRVSVEGNLSNISVNNK